MEIEVLREAAHYSELTINKVAKAIVPGMTEADVLQLFNTTAFSWSPDIINVANAHTIGENFTPSFIPPHTRINRGDISRRTAVMSSNRDRRRKYLFPQPGENATVPQPLFTGIYL